VSGNGDGTTTVTVSLTEAEFNTMIATALANSANPLLRNPTVDFQNGQVVISGEHDRRDGGGRVSGTVTLSVTVVNEAINAQITAVNIEGLDITDERVAELNQRLAEALANRAVRDNPRATLSSITITNDVLQINITISRARG
jgi:hypothetical protein